MSGNRDIPARSALATLFAIYTFLAAIGITVFILFTKNFRNYVKHDAADQDPYWPA
jgi:hypothetical protein